MSETSTPKTNADRRADDLAPGVQHWCSVTPMTDAIRQGDKYELVPLLIFPEWLEPASKRREILYMWRDLQGVLVFETEGERRAGRLVDIDSSDETFSFHLDFDCGVRTEKLRDLEGIYRPRKTTAGTANDIGDNGPDEDQLVERFRLLTPGEKAACLEHLGKHVERRGQRTEAEAEELIPA